MWKCRICVHPPRNSLVAGDAKNSMASWLLLLSWPFLTPSLFTMCRGKNSFVVDTDIISVTSVDYSSEYWILVGEWWEVEQDQTDFTLSWLLILIFIATKNDNYISIVISQDGSRGFQTFCCFLVLSWIVDSFIKSWRHPTRSMTSHSLSPLFTKWIMYGMIVWDLVCLKFWCNKRNSNLWRVWKACTSICNVISFCFAKFV